MSTFSLHGFSLLETLMYMALFSILVEGMCIGMFAVRESAARLQAKSVLVNTDLSLTQDPATLTPDSHSDPGVTLDTFQTQPISISSASFQETTFRLSALSSKGQPVRRIFTHYFLQDHE